VSNGARGEWNIHLMGGFHLTRGDRAVSLPLNLQRVVAFTALNEPSLPRSRVIAALWPEAEDGQGASNLRTSLWRLARAAPVLVAERSALAVAPGVEVDVRRLATLAERAFDGDETSLVETCRYHAELLPGWHDDWLLIERERLRQLVVHLLDSAADACIEHDQCGRAVDLAHRAIQLEPLRESSHRTLIRGYLASGDRIAAVAHFRRLAGMLERELGLPPDDTTTTLVVDLLASGARREPAVQRR
jgi:DNA-binding SARP family transcriptional activator